jgi:hypothetical protein
LIDEGRDRTPLPVARRAEVDEITATSF